MERRKAKRPQRILLVDDSDDVRELWRLWLTFWGFRVEEARDGHQALQKAFNDAPDLILMDLWMPVVDGVEALRRLKADSRTANVPVLALSAQTSFPTAAAVVDEGAEVLLAKPCDPDVLLDHIRAALSKEPARN